MHEAALGDCIGHLREFGLKKEDFPKITNSTVLFRTVPL